MDHGYHNSRPVETPIPLKGNIMSELQSGDAAPEVEAAPVEDLNQGAELATATEPEPEKTPGVDEAAKKQEAIQKAINEKTFKAKQAERNEKVALARVAELEQAERDRKAALVRDIPPMPDSFDDNFDEQLAQRDEAIRIKAEFDTSQQVYAQQQQFQQQQQAAQRAVDNQSTVTAHKARASKLGIDDAEMTAAESQVLTFGLAPECLEHILKDESSPLIVKHLAANPQEGFELAAMSPYAIGVHLEGIKAKAEALKPKSSNAPAPVDTLQGNGADPEAGKYKNLGGVKFE